MNLMQQSNVAGTQAKERKKTNSSKGEYIIGLAVLIVALILGELFLKTTILFRLVIGMALGYALMRAYTGFAGSVNRAYRTGSTKLMRAMMLMFFVSCVLTAGILFKANPSTYDLWINPVNTGLIIGGIMFGLGMALSSCCATGVLTDLTVGFPRALTTLVFFGIGVFLGFPLQNTASWVMKSWFTSPVGKKLSGGVFFPDLFKWDGLNGYLGALVLTLLLCIVVVLLSYGYEKLRKNRNTYTGVDTEMLQDQADTFDTNNFKAFSESTYYKLFAKPWTLVQGALALSILFAILMSATKAGWGASTPYGIWFAKILMAFGLTPEAVSAFTHMKAASFTTPLFQQAASVQDIGIIIGTAIYLLASGVFSKTFKEGLHIKFREGTVYALGGLCMGFGTRLANGCNVGALYTPIANFSLSGWVFFIFLVAGAILGNIFGKVAFGHQESGFLG